MHMIRTGLLGRSILASRSPWLHEQEAKAQGIALSYTLFDFDALGLADHDLERKLHELADAGLAGVNVTFPFKQAVIPLLDELADCAQAVGAVNTVAMRGGRLTGYNTDKSGFEESLAENLPGASLERILQLGAGGAGSAVANALLDSGTSLLEITDVETERADELVRRLRSRHGSDRIVARPPNSLDTGSIDGIVNTTPMGMASCPGMAIAAELVTSRHWVADIVYFPLETELLRIAHERGCRIMNGCGMVIGQAARAFEILTGSIADKARMGASFLNG
jgi:shikimate dehydrogenase